MTRVVVIGAGMAGLACAVRLGAAGHSVVVLEQASEPGGKVSRFSAAGFSWDTGATLLTLPAVYRDLFATTGAPLEAEVELVAVDPICRYRFPDGTVLDMPNTSRARIRSALDHALGTGAGQQWLSVLERGEQVWQLTRDDFLGSPHRGPSTATRLRWRPDAVRTIAPQLSLRRLGERMLTHPHVIRMLDRYATYAGSDPRLAPASFVAIPYVEQAFGGWYVSGGIAELAAATARRASALGVEIRCSTRATAVEVADGAVTGVRLDDTTVLPADVVVSALDAAALYRDLLPGANSRVKAQHRRFERSPASSSAFVLLLGLRGAHPELGHHTVLFGPDGDAEADAVFGSGGYHRRPRPVPDPTIHLCAPLDPATRPDAGHRAVYVMVNAPIHDPHGGTDWETRGLAEAYHERVLSALGERGIDLRDSILTQHRITPADLARRTGSVGGAIYGTATHGGLSPLRRPPNISGIGGLYLAGGSVHPGGGLPLVAMSAHVVADLIGKAQPTPAQR